ncbi:hypothetical protein Tco_1159596, partial [Tanacetum coccineum]
PVEKPAKKPATKRQSVGVQIKDNPGVSLSKKKAATKAKRSKGIELLSKAALLEEAQLKKVIKRRKWETNIHQAGGSSEVADLDSEGDSDDANNDDDQQSDDERTEYDDDKNDEEYDLINKEMYDGVNVELKDAETVYEVKDDDQETVIAAPATQKTEVPLQSSSISSDYATKFLNINNIPSTDTEIISMMDIKVQHKDPSIQTSPLLTVPITVILETSSAPATTIPPSIPSFIPLPQ